MTEFSPQQCLALVERSPAAVAVHDKPAWLGIFARYNIVEDPVGSPAHLSGVYDAREKRSGNGPLSRFYDTFIAPNDIRFEVDRDVVCGLHVVRDLTIVITMSPRVVVRTPMHLRYELQEEGGELRIFRLAAHWEMAGAVSQQMAHGLESLKVGMATGWRMVRNLGPRGTMGFMRALSNIGDAGKQQVNHFVRYFNAGDIAAAQALLDHPELPVGWPACGQARSLGQLLADGDTLRFGKMLAAGNWVTASFDLQQGGELRRGVAFFEFERRNLKIVDMSFYWQD